jgi:hypothetical protein
MSDGQTALGFVLSRKPFVSSWQGTWDKGR